MKPVTFGLAVMPTTAVGVLAVDLATGSPEAAVALSPFIAGFCAAYLYARVGGDKA